MSDLETWLDAPSLVDVAVRLESLRKARPMNGDASNLMLDNVIQVLCEMTPHVGGDGSDVCPRFAAEVERDRLKAEREAEYMRTVGNPEWQREMRAKHERYPTGATGDVGP